MRLGQLARKYNLTQDQVIRFLNEVQPELGPFHQNTKLDDGIENQVISRFSLSSEKNEEALQVPNEAITTETSEQPAVVTEIEDAKEIEASLQLELDPTLPPIQIPEPKPVSEQTDEKSIATDRLLELLESEEASDLSEITHIKAPKKELSGLKVVGKIDLIEPKTKTVDKIEPEEAKPKPARNERHGRQRMSDEEQEKRRLKAKRKQEEYRARQEKRRKEAEKKQKKAQNKTRYEQKMQQIKTSQPKRKPIIQDTAPEIDEQPPKPTSLLGKFWAWLKA